MAGGGMGGIWTTFALLALASAGPLHRYPRESEDYQNDLSVYANYTANEVCFSEGEVFQKGDMMPNPGPCEECRCEPPSIVCNMIKCPTNNNGCRTIQRANHCCPDYNCECDYNGQLYNDGERLDLPEEPCQVCYCKGGEVMCNSITCYHRDDCDPIQVPGQCCPKYENCPVRDMGSSSSDDKNVLVRSTNKTNHVPPKREMNPWLLTKIPPTSSSAPPRPSQDTTTEGGNIIIVSDWLTERRTTTEDLSSDEERHDDLELDSTAEPDLFTDSDHLTTVLKQDISSDGSMVVKNSDVITPIDEVIFTRIDGPKENKEVNLGEPIQISSKDTQHKLTTDISSSVTNSYSKENTTDMNNIKTPLNKTINNGGVKENLSLNLPEKQSLSEVRPMETTDTKKPNNLSDKREEINPDPKYYVSTESPIYPNGLNNTLEPDTMNTDSETTPSNVDLFKKANTINAQRDVSLEHLFGLNGLTIGEIEPETTTKVLLGSYTTEKEEAFTDINEFTGNSLEDQTIGESKVGELKITVNIDKSTSDGFSDTTTNGLFDNDVTTPFFTEVNVQKEDLMSSKTKQENATKEMSENYTTELPKIKETEPNKSKIAIAHPTDQTIDSMRENGFVSGSKNTNGINKSSISIENKIKRNNFNSSVQQENAAHGVEGSTLLSSNKGSLTGEITQPTTITSEVNPEMQNRKTSAIVIAQSSVDPPVTNVVKDETLPDIIIKGDESEGGKELVSDEPPVLELNSHVPFLQLGGHGNVDPGMSMLGENHQTTNEKEKILNEKDSEIIETFSVSDSTPSLKDDRFPIKQINATETMLSPEKISRVEETNQEVNQEIKKDDEVKNQFETETTTAMVFTTSHIPLTPGDLKVLAEYLINDTIKTVPEKDIADYIPNQWLKGNLTSEEKIASIFSAANISIAVMNKTDNKVKTFITEPTRGVTDKFEKDKLFTGINALNNVKTYNKTGFIQGKSDEYSDSPKINSEPETPLNDEAKLSFKTVKTESPISLDSKVIPDQNTTIKNNEMSSIKYQGNAKDHLNIKYTQPQTSTQQTVQIQSISQNLDENNLRFDKVNPADTAKRNQLPPNNLRNDKVPDDTTSFSSTFTVTTNNPHKQASP